MTGWEEWLRHPERRWLRRALFQVHLWVGIGASLYILVVCVTGSIVVYRNELYRLATPAPIVVEAAGAPLSDEALTAAAVRAYPGFRVSHVYKPRRADRPVDIWVERAGRTRKRLFNPYTGADLGNTVPLSILAVSTLIDLHDNLLGGAWGRAANGVGGALTAVLALTGLVIWWPGVATWRRGLGVRRGVGWKRLNWDLHSAVGFWTAPAVLVFGVTGVYLGFPSWFADLADRLEPQTDDNIGTRVVDAVTYWLGALHFGRFGGGTTKALWALLGLMPVVLLVTGALMWWNRVLGPFARRQLGARSRTAVGGATGWETRGAG